MFWCPIADHFTRTPFKFLNAGKNNSKSLQVSVTSVSFSVTGYAGREDHLAERSPFEGAGLRGESKYRRLFVLRAFSSGTNETSRPRGLSPMILWPAGARELPLSYCIALITRHICLRSV